MMLTTVKTPRTGNGAGIQFLRANVAYAGDGCLLWPFSRIRGYGIVCVDGENIRAHRLMCELVKGAPPSDEHEAAHSCGNGHGGCIHPLHLSWKTPTENQADRKVHGTAGRRMPGFRYKLTAEQAAEIRSLEGQKSQDELAAMFGCTRENIGRIIRGLNWRVGTKQPRQFTDDEVRTIRRHEKPDEIIASRFGVSRAAIQRIRTGASYARVSALAE